MARGGDNRATSWLREHSEPVLLGALVVAAMAFVAFAWFNQPKPAEYVPFTPAAAASPTPSASPLPLVTFVGDSYTEGSAMNSGPSTVFSALLATQEGFRANLLVTGGVGYVAQNPSIPNVTLVTLSASIPADSNIVVFFGSRNDSAAYDDVKAAALQAFANAKALAPSASIVVFGPSWVDAKPPTNITDDRDAVRDAAAEAGVTFRDPIAEGWFTEGNTALIGSDGVHPTDAGHEYLAEKIGASLAPLVAAAKAAH